MPEFAKHVEILRGAGPNYRIRIDGQEFPWCVREEIATAVRRGEWSTVTLTLFADEVSVRDESPRSAVTTDSEKIKEWFDSPPPRFDCGSDRTSRLARAEAARDQAEELLANVHKALEENHATIEELRGQLAERDEKRNKVGVAYVEVRPDFTEFQRQVEQVLEATRSKGLGRSTPGGRRV